MMRHQGSNRTSMTMNNILICPYCNSEDTETYIDSETDEFFHTCNTCEFLWEEGHKQWFE